MKYTKQEKNAYFKNLRQRWQESKKLAENDQKARALWKETAGKYSYASFYFTLLDMRANGFSGLPYVNCKTFNGWQKSGYKVKKGEKSRISGIVWLHPIYRTKDGEELEDLENCYPKIYHLFHDSQTERRTA